MKKGFTLIELLVVVLIIGILSAIALPQYRRAVMRSRFTEIELNLKALAQAQERYYLANGVYTTNTQDLDIELPTPKCLPETGDSSCGYAVSSYYTLPEVRFIGYHRDLFHMYPKEHKYPDCDFTFKPYVVYANREVSEEVRKNLGFTEKAGSCSKYYRP